MAVTREPDPPPAFQFIGSRFWLVTAAISLFGTTSTILTGVAALGGGIPLNFEESLGCFIGLFFLGALGCGMLGGLALLLKWNSESGELTIRGRRVSDRALRQGLLFCYAAPWLSIAMLWLLITVAGVH